jgi:hypothetical protein
MVGSQPRLASATETLAPRSPHNTRWADGSTPLTQSDPDRWETRVVKVDDGFFIGAAESQSRMGAAFSTRVVDGIPAPTQFFRVGVDVQDHATPRGEIWVVHSATPTGNRRPPTGVQSRDEARLGAVRSSLLAAFPNATMCFTIEDREGFSRAVGEEAHVIAIAAAVSVVKYFAAWDGSDPITIEMADAQFLVSVAYTDKDYRAIVRRCHSTPPHT